MIDISVVDKFVGQHGQFCFLDWLLEENILPYAGYESWRYGKTELLDGFFSITQLELEELAKKVQSSCKELGLASEHQDYYMWGGGRQKCLKLTKSSFLSKALEEIWVSPKDAPQMDLFMDNTPTILENQVLEAIANRDFVSAEKALEQLSELNSAHKKLGAYRDLINYGLYVSESPMIDSGALSDEFNAVEREVAPLAKELLGARQRDFLAFAWRRVANSYTELDNQDDSTFNLSFALLQIPDWGALQACLEQDKRLYQSAELMQRLTLVYSNAKQGALFILIWGKLFERFPEQAETFLSGAGTLLKSYWDGFLAFDDDWSERYFLSYLVIQQPGIIHSLDNLPQRGGVEILEPVNKALLALVKARLKGDEEKIYREALKKACPAMLDCYLNKRDWQASLRTGL